jgi:hypothetical protein
MEDQRPWRERSWLFRPSLGSLRLSSYARVFIHPVVIWARVTLDRHDLSQSLAGAALGASTMLGVFVVMAGHCTGISIICV